MFDTITLYIIIIIDYIVVCNYTHIILERREKKCPTRTHLVGFVLLLLVSTLTNIGVPTRK